MILSNTHCFFFAGPDPVRNLAVTPLDSTRLLVSWEPPPCPNGPISGYTVFYRQANSTQSVNISSSTYANISLDENRRFVIIPSLVSGRSYTVHVRAFTNYNGSVLSGDADTELLTRLTITSNANDSIVIIPETFMDEDNVSRPAVIRFANTINTFLPRPEAIGAGKEVR